MGDLVWVVGRGGMLGRAVTSQFRETFTNRPITWPSTSALVEIGEEAARFLSQSAGRRPVVIWCAGAGVIGTRPEELSHETAILERLLGVLRSHASGTFFHTSSAGGVYGGAKAVPITEETAPAPLSDYGRNKLAQEALVVNFAGESGWGTVTGRVANLYGPGQRLSKPQGLISQICLATLTRRPVTLYVSLDTLRDYLYVQDCARMIQHIVERTTTGTDSRVAVKILASQRSISIGGVLAEARRVLGGQRTSVITIPSSRSSQQGNALAFRSSVWSDVDAHATTSLPVGIHRTAEHLRRQLQLGSLVA